MTDTSTWATAVAAYGLGPPREALGEGPVEDATWPKLLELARGQRLIGLMRAAAQDGVLALRAEQWEGLERAFSEVAFDSAEAERSVAELVTHLQACEIECRVLKGPALAHLDYPSPDLRPFVHANLLVRDSRFGDTIEVLGRLGFERAHAEPAAGFDARFRKGTVLVSRTGSSVEVHRTIADGPFALIVKHGELFRTSTPVQVAGTQVEALGREERLLHACFEARVGDTRPLLIRLRDIVQMVLSHDLDLERIEHLSGSWGAQSLVAEAVRRAWTLLGVTDMVPLSQWAAAHPTSRKDRRRLLAYHTARSRTLVSVQTLGAIRPRTAVPGYLRAVAIPDRAYLEGHYSGHMNRWWYASRSVVSIGPRPRVPVRDKMVGRAPDDELLELSWARAAAPYPA
jgi:hypothetical protein